MNTIQLTIPTPCHESWDKMNAKEQGRFCNSCSKIVVDFSKMSDAQLIQYFENFKSENICGRVNTEQLDRALYPVTISQTRKKIKWYWQVAAAFSMFFFKGQFIKAQDKVAVSDSTKKIREIKDRPVMLGGIRRIHPDTIAKIPAKLTQIFITDESKNAIPYASVQLLPEGKWIAADAEGKINLAINHQVEKLVISAVGFEGKTVALDDLKSNFVSLHLQSALLGEVVVSCNTGTVNQMAMGGMGIAKIEVMKNQENNTITDNKTNGQLQLYPNPAAKSGFVTMNIDTDKPGEFGLLITDVSGKKMLQQKIQLVSKTQPVKFKIPGNWASGQYFISMRSSKEEILLTAALLVL